MTKEISGMPASSNRGSSRPQLRGEFASSLENFLERWNTLNGTRPSAFQSSGWLEAWYTTIGAQPGVAALWLCIFNDATRDDVLLLPLVSRRKGSVSIVEMADLGVTDYNAGACHTPERTSAEDFSAHAGAVRTAIQLALRGHDLLALDKMLAWPFNQTLRASVENQPSTLFGNFTQTPDNWDDWRYSLEKTVRKELERSWRVFERYPDARFVRPQQGQEALQLLLALETQQAQRMQHAGDAYLLNHPPYQALYRQRLTEGFEKGEVIITALMSENNLVAALFGLFDGRSYVMLRICHAGDAWKTCSPGKLLIERTMHHLHQQGCRHFDFAIGDYFHKRVFQVEHTLLWEGRLPLSWRGHVATALWRLKHALKRQGWFPAIRRLLKRP